MRQNNSELKKRNLDSQGVTEGKEYLSSPPPATNQTLLPCNSSNYTKEKANRRAKNESIFFPVQSVPERKKMNSTARKSLPAQIKAYTMPQLTTGKCYWYISFYAFDPQVQQLRRKRIRISPKFKKVSERKQYANDLLERIGMELRQGWNPWINFSSPEQYSTWQDVCSDYRNWIAKCKAEALMREKTWKGYTSFLDNFCQWNDSQKQPIFYAYQFDAKLLTRFVDYLWLDKGLSVRTRDNYVMWLRTFGKWLVGHSYVETDPSASLQCIGGKIKSNKNRTVIPPDAMQKLKEYCQANNKHFLLACYILYYCLIRPNEMTYIQLHHISIERGTIYIPDYSSKNGKGANVTLPDTVVKLMIELNIFSHQSDSYLFSDGLRPGNTRRSPKIFTDYWSHYVRKALKFPPEWKFYSLKDTGITDLIRENTDLLSVRNQARHHSLLMTDIYTPHDIEQANDVIRHRKAAF